MSCRQILHQRIEPVLLAQRLTACRIKEAIAFAKPYQPDAFLAVGGGSVIDTAKLMNLYTSFPGILACLILLALCY